MVLFDESPPAAAVTADAKRVTAIKLETVGAEAGATPAAGQGMLRLSGACTAGDGPSYAYVTVWTGEQRVTPKTRLSYCVFARPESVSHNFALDLATPNFYPDNLRDKPDAVDQRGVRAHPALGYQGGRNVGQWSYREISLAPLAGEEVTAAYAAWDSGGGQAGGEFVGYFDEAFLWELDDAAAAKRAEALKRKYDTPDEPEIDLSGYPPPVRLGPAVPLPGIAVPPAAETAARNSRRGLVTLGDNGYFAFENGEPFLPWGLFGSEIYTALAKRDLEATGPLVWWSHVPSGGDAGNNSEPQDCSEQAWEDYFAYCAGCGITALRLFTYGYATPAGGAGYYFSLDAVGKVHPVLWDKLDRFMTAGYRHGIRFLFTLVASPDWTPYVRHSRPDHPENQVLHEARRQYAEPELATISPARRRFLVDERTVEISNAFDNAPFFEDADVAVCVEGYLRELLPRLKDDPRVFALEIMNETFPVKHPEWARDHVVRLCRELAPGRPVTLSHTLGSGVQSLAAADFIGTAGLDCYNWHSYFGVNSPLTADLAMNCLYYNAPVPGFPTEGPAYYGGAKKETVNEPLRRLAIRDYLWLPLVTGCPGSVLWAPENSAVSPWEWEELRTFHRAVRDLAQQVDFATLRRRRPAVGLSLDLPQGLRLAYSSYLLRRGIPFEFAADVSRYEHPVNGPISLSDFRKLSAPVIVLGSDCAPCLVDEELTNLLIYIPNYRQGKRGEGERTVELLTDLPAGRYEVRACNLDALTASTGAVPGRGRLTIAANSAHDFVVWLHKTP